MSADNTAVRVRCVRCNAEFWRADDPKRTPVDWGPCYIWTADDGRLLDTCPGCGEVISLLTTGFAGER